MVIHKRFKKYLILPVILMITVFSFSGRVSGEVKPIMEAQEKLTGISEEEQKVLKELFFLTQEIEELDREEARLADEINSLNSEIGRLDQDIVALSEDYDRKLMLLEQVLVSYQKGGPASYIEIILSARNFSAFIKSLNLIKDISRNVDELLASIEENKQIITDERENRTEALKLLADKLEESQRVMESKVSLKENKESYLASLAEEKQKYTEYLGNLELMWGDIKTLFSGIVGEFSRIIGEGHFSLEDMNISFQIFSVKGAVHEDTFNRILAENSTFPKVVFHFDTDKVILEVPEKNLVLEGQFILVDKSAMEFVVESGSFYQMPLEQASIDELFKEGSLKIDFEAIAGDMVLIDIDLQSVGTKDGYLEFAIKTGLFF